MRAAAGLLVALLFAGPSISFFKYQRAVPAANSAGQRYIVVDDAMWQHARPDLADMRLYSAPGEIAYTLDTERGGAEVEQKEIRILQPATIGGKTQFLLDMEGLAEYDRVTLKLATRNFVAHALVSGQDDAHGSHWALLGATTLYDLSDERLGSNSALHFPLSTYKFLQVSIDNSVKPADVQGGAAGITRSETAVWRAIGSGLEMTQQGKDTIAIFTLPGNAPVERIVFDIDPAQPNFRRDLQIEGTLQGSWIATGEIARVHMQRGGRKIDVEQTTVYAGGRGPLLKAIIHNGDDAPLKINGVRLEQYERRVYVDAMPATPITLYYGDGRLSAPVYDYAKLFQKDAAASRVDLGPETANATYTGRPDGRPWSERHPAVLWAAILAAVLVLGVLALKSMRSTAAS